MDKFGNKGSYKVFTEKKDCKEIWDYFSPHKTIDDEWEFRNVFVRPLGYELNFITAYENKKPVALLPLQKNNLNGLMPPYYPKDGISFLEFFGGDDTDDNLIYTKNLGSDFKNEASNYLECPVYLAPLNESFGSLPNSDYYENKYFLDLASYENYEDFLLDKWNSGSRKKILQQIRKIEREHKIEIVYDNAEDINLLSELNIQRFGENSSFAYPYRKEIFRELAEKFNYSMISLLIDGKTEAVSFGLIYKDTYVGMNAGVNSSIPDLAKFLTLLQINRAIDLGCHTYDAGKGDSGWKENFKFSKKPQYKIILVKN